MYYKIIKNLDLNLRTYIEMPIWDEWPHMGTYHSTLGVPRPKKGDYLVYENGSFHFLSVTKNRNFEGVSFEERGKVIKNLKRWIKEGFIRKTTPEIFNREVELNNKADEIYIEICAAEMMLDIPNAEVVKKAQKNIDALKKRFHTTMKKIKTLNLS